MPQAGFVLGRCDFRDADTAAVSLGPLSREGAPGATAPCPRPAQRARQALAGGSLQLGLSSFFVVAGRAESVKFLFLRAESVRAKHQLLVPHTTGVVLYPVLSR